LPPGIEELPPGIEELPPGIEELFPRAFDIEDVFCYYLTRSMLSCLFAMYYAQSS